jgi:hypothetical protein
MKTKIFLLMLLSFICPITVLAQNIQPTIIPTGTTANFYSVWSYDANTAFAVGDNGIISKYNGSNAVIIPNTSTAMLKSVSGCSPAEVWAVGTGGTAVKINSSGTTVYNTGNTVQLRCVKVFASNDVWVCGPGIIVHWNGSAWINISHSYPNFSFGQILGSSSSDMYFSGKDLYAPYTSRIFRYNGSTFTEIVNDPSGREWWRISTFDNNLFYLFCLNGTYSFTKSTGIITEIYPGGSKDHYAFDANSGVICGGDSGVVKYEGSTWTVLRNLPSSNAVFAPQGNGSKVFFAGQGGTFYFSNLTVGIPEIKLEPIKSQVYPNPTSNQFTIDLMFDKKVDANIDLFNSSGQRIKQVQEFTGNEFSTKVDVSDLPPGIYFIKVNTAGGGSFSTKLLITK